MLAIYAKPIMKKIKIGMLLLFKILMKKHNLLRLHGLDLIFKAKMLEGAILQF